MTNQQIVLAARPTGAPTVDHFALRTIDRAEPADGEIVVEQQWLSLDPYMRGRMNEGKSYAAPQPLGEVMIGGTVGEVIESKHASFKAGDTVVGMGGWQQYQLADASQPGVLRKVDATQVPLSAYIGVLGMPGVTAWYGLNRICQPKAGQTIVVSAASGAVGSVVGQLAKAHGCRAVGFAGGADKCKYVVEELGFDACIDYKAHKDVKSLIKALKEAAPDGVDGYFENVGGDILDAVLTQMNAFGRIAVCGMISGYNGGMQPLAQPALILQSRLTVEGFIVGEHMEVWPTALKELGALVISGKLKFRESVAPSIEQAPEAFVGLLKGKNFGKQLVKLV